MQKIRAMSIKDYAKVIKLWQSTEGMGINDYDDSRKCIKRFLQMNPKTCFVVEQNDKEIIGTILGGFDGRRGLIYHLMVKPEYRNNGLGKKLLEKAENGFKKRGVMRIYIVIFSNNTRGNKFWEDNGYEFRDFLKFMSKKLF